MKRTVSNYKAMKKNCAVVGYILIVLSLVLSTAGCGHSGPETIKIRGRVTFDGGQCPAAGTVYFVPVDVSSDLPCRPASGNFDADGKFTVTSFRPGDGLLPGKYKVRIECWKQPPDNEGLPGVSYVKDDYEAPGLVVEPDSREPVKVIYDVPRRR